MIQYQMRQSGPFVFVQTAPAFRLGAEDAHGANHVIRDEAHGLGEVPHAHHVLIRFFALRDDLFDLQGLAQRLQDAASRPPSVSSVS